MEPLAHFKSLSYRLLNRVCCVDITRVLLLDASKPLGTVSPSPAIDCKLLDRSDLEELLDDEDFGLTPQFIADFGEYGFAGVAALVDGRAVGLLFMAANRIAARHNSGGPQFNGIGMSLPTGVHYLFKVLIKPEFRGRRFNTSMTVFAIEHLKSAGLKTVVTTTDWTNDSFLKSAAATGFRRCGFAAEWVLASRHFYHLPAPLNPCTGKPAIRDRTGSPVRFLSGA